MRYYLFKIYQINYKLSKLEQYIKNEKCDNKKIMQ